MKKLAICNSENGSALMLVLILMMSLLLVAGWLSSQTQTDTKIVNAIKNYSKTFQLADGALELAVYVLRNKYRPSNESVSWNPVKQVADAGKVSVPLSYINMSTAASLEESYDKIDFEELADYARSLGIKRVLSGPFVRSSFSIEEGRNGVKE